MVTRKLQLFWTNWLYTKILIIIIVILNVLNGKRVLNHAESTMF